MVCLDTAEEILRKHEKTTYSVGLSPVTAAHTCRGPSKDKQVNCAVAIDSKAKLVAFGYLHPHFVYDNPQQIYQFIEKNKQIPPLFFPCLSQPPRKKKKQ